jgi:hypothetical protein
MKIDLFEIEEVSAYDDYHMIYSISLFGREIGRIKFEDGVYDIEEKFLVELVKPALQALALKYEGEIIG